MSYIGTLGELEEYILRQLGKGVINVEITPDQLRDCIDDAIQHFLEESYDGSVERYVLHTAVTGQREYEMPPGTLTVLDVLPVDANLGSTSGDYMWSIQNILIQDGLLDPYKLTGNIGYYQSLLEYLSTLRYYFSKRYIFDYNMLTRKLYIGEVPDNTQRFVVRCCMTIDAVNADDEGNSVIPANLYNHRWIKRWATARAKQQWAQNLSKFTVTLPGAAQLNSSELRQEATQELDALTLELEEKYASTPEFFVQ
jgi:hypothetical protein